MKSVELREPPVILLRSAVTPSFSSATVTFQVAGFPLLRSRRQKPINPPELKKVIADHTRHNPPEKKVQALDPSSGVDHSKLDVNQEASKLTNVLKRLLLPFQARAFEKWVDYLRFLRIRACFLKMIHSNLGLAWLKVKSVDMLRRREIRIRKTMLHVIGRHQAIGWTKWRNVVSFLRLSQKRKDALLRWRAWRFAPAFRRWKMLVTTSQGTYKPSLQHCVSI